jgi:hypothetical protein
MICVRGQRGRAFTTSGCYPSVTRAKLPPGPPAIHVGLLEKAYGRLRWGRAATAA